jgi:hypothetical protein
MHFDVHFAIVSHKVEMVTIPEKVPLLGGCERQMIAVRFKESRDSTEFRFIDVKVEIAKLAESNMAVQHQRESRAFERDDANCMFFQ